MILITGGTGFLGKVLFKKLLYLGEEVYGAGQNDGDLTDKPLTSDLFRKLTPTIVYHLAARVGGIGANQRAPADFWHDNLMMGLNVLEACRVWKVKKLIMVNTTCAYPKVPPHIPFREDDLFAGYPEETNAPYGIAKRALMVGAWAYRQQYELDAVNVFPTNLYGPGDHFDLEKSHVIPAMIRKFHEAKEKEEKVTLWGTGQPTRDFLYVDDAADALVLAKDKLTDGMPVNVGSGREISIEDLAEKVADAVGYKDMVFWDRTKPDGQPRRTLDISRARNILGWEPKISLHEGLERTYTSYVEGL